MVKTERIKLLFNPGREQPHYTQFPKGSTPRVYGSLLKEYGPAGSVIDVKIVRAFLRNGYSHGLDDHADIDEVLAELTRRGLITAA